MKLKPYPRHHDPHDVLEGFALGISWVLILGVFAAWAFEMSRLMP